MKQADKVPSDPVLDIVAQEFAEGGVRLVELAPAVENAENVRGESKQAVQVLLGLLALLQRLLQVAVDPGQGLGAVPIAAPEPDDGGEQNTGQEPPDQDQAGIPGAYHRLEWRA